LITVVCYFKTTHVYAIDLSLGSFLCVVVWLLACFSVYLLFRVLLVGFGYFEPNVCYSNCAFTYLVVVIEHVTSPLQSASKDLEKIDLEGAREDGLVDELKTIAAHYFGLHHLIIIAHKLRYFDSEAHS